MDKYRIHFLNKIFISDNVQDQTGRMIEAGQRWSGLDVETKAKYAAIAAAKVRPTLTTLNIAQRKKFVAEQLSALQSIVSNEAQQL